MKCNFCKDDIKQWDGKQVGYITGSVNENGDGKNHVHIHGSLNDRIVAEDVVDATIEAANLTEIYKKKYGAEDKMAGIKEIIFHNRQRIGDMFMFTCAVRDFKKAYPNIKVNVLSTCGHIWDHNPNVDRTIQPFYKNGKTLETIKAADLFAGDTNVLKIGPSQLTNASNRIDWHFANAFRVSIEEHLGIYIPQGESRGDVYFTQEEFDAPRITEKPYWIICTGGEKGWGCKMYPTVRWQEFVSQNQDVTFFQIGAKGDAHVKLTGPNVVDWTGKTEDRNTGIRDLLKLFLNAEGSIGLVSFHMHLSGALKKPCVVVAGAREPVSFTRYAGHQYIATDGTLPCAITACWHCDIKACTNQVTVNGEIVPKCVDMIEPSEVSRYFNRYYIGGRLRKDKPSEKPRGLNIVPTPARVVEAPKSIYNTYGLKFNGGSITERDWEFICKTIDEHKVESVLEFGAGLSTLLFNDKVKNVVSYEDKPGWIKKLNDLRPCNIQLWDGKTFTSDESFDMAFVDGPANDSPRDVSTRVASERANVVIVHDASREWALKYQEQYLAPGFDGPFKGGHRCHLWVKKSANNIIKLPQAKTNTKAKSIKFVSTARGWGGCARSITTIMKLLLQEGHKVEFIPFRNAVSSREFQDCIKNELQGLKVTTDYSTVKEKCDVLVMYADDYIWEFGSVEVIESFSGLQADKKIMVLNYRRGDVGKAEWTKGWDKYIFLNKTQEAELLKLLPNVSTKVLAPCTDLSKFLAMKPSFDGDIRLIRHSSQGDTKFDGAFNFEVDMMLGRNDLSIHMMPGPSFLQKNPRAITYPKNTPPVHEFLTNGNLFWYSLPQGYMDMGPRVILEAMAVGLPILADNWGGAVDRVTPETGWLCDTKEQMKDIVMGVSLPVLEKMGAAAKERARAEFHMDKWVKEIVS